jgi:hypothetical protein
MLGVEITFEASVAVIVSSAAVESDLAAEDAAGATACYQIGSSESVCTREPLGCGHWSTWYQCCVRMPSYQPH